MPKHQSFYRTRNEALYQKWHDTPDSLFANLGFSRATLQEAQQRLVGHIVLPGDASYDADRMLINPVFNPTPCMIVFCECESDVRIALRLAARGNAPFTIRSGGHCSAGFSGGFGVLIDVSGLKDIAISADGSRVTVGTGCPFKRFNAWLEDRGLHVPAGECDDVCVGGFVQGGGLGFTSGSFGMNCDNVISMRVMLWDGSIVVAQEGNNMDLWWAMRGGTGGNFGVLLSVEYRTFPLAVCTGWALAWSMETPQDRARCVAAMMALQNQYIIGSPFGAKLTLQVLMVYQSIINPSLPPLPKKVPVFMIRGLWVGAEADARRAMAPLQSLDGCITQFCITDKYTTVLHALLSQPQDQPITDPRLGPPCEDKSSRYISEPLSSAAYGEIFDYFVLQSPNDLSYAYFEVYGGKITAPPLPKNAFIHRDALFNSVLDVYWYLPRDRADSEKFLHGWNQTMEKYWSNHAYQNYASIALPDYAFNYWGPAVPLLSLIKAKYDPEGRFSFAQQIPSLSPDDHASSHIPAEYEDILHAAKEQISYAGGTAPFADWPGSFKADPVPVGLGGHGS